MQNSDKDVLVLNTSHFLSPQSTDNSLASSTQVTLIHCGVIYCYIYYYISLSFMDL